VLVAIVTTRAAAHPQHAAGSEPAGRAGETIPPVRGIATKPSTVPTPPVSELSDERLLELANRAAEQGAGETITIVDEAPAESASSVHLDRETLARRARTQMSDVLRQVPGLMVSQHAGGGKSDQYFIRGFDADHGTDIAIFADGVPVNLTSHGHGQGYADTHWMIPELVDTVDVHKGPYSARYGDFYTAGALELRTIDELPNTGTVYIAGSAPLSAGRVAVDRRLVAMASPTMREGDRTLLAAEIGERDGAFVNPQDFQRSIATGKWQGDAGTGRIELEANWYTARWNQSGQIPTDLVASGALDRFGAIDPSEGGRATRASLAAGYSQPAAAGTVRLAAFGVRNKLDLFSNFTLYARDVEHGDQIEQTDDRWLYGGSATYERAIHRDGLDALVTTGMQVRVDDVGTSLWHTAQRRRLDRCFEGMNPCNHHDSRVINAAAFAEANVIPVSWLHVFPGLRVDGFSWNVADQMTSTGAETASRALVSPKLSAELHPTEQINFFANSGGGFHSNDARTAVATKGQGALARAWGGEVGARVKPSAATRVAMDVWYLHLSSEQVWSGDNGGTEASEPTHRFGLDLEASAELASWLAVDGNVTWAKARFAANAGNGGAVALAPRWMGSAGVTARRKASFASVRGRGISDRPGSEDGALTAEGYVIVDVVAGTQRGAWGLNLTVQNLLDSAWREAQFAEASRVAPTADVVEQMHFTPGAPLTATLTAAYRY
jgi:hypothetical protein